jgi:ubiquinone/menaquinone biosynthesis C-methylase UbiE
VDRLDVSGVAGTRIMNKARNIDRDTVEGFADEWSRYDQSALSESELKRMFDNYFRIFPWAQLPANARGFDMGCGSGRWAKFVAKKTGHLALVDVSQTTLDVARKNLSGIENVEFLEGSANDLPLPDGSQDFGYSLGVLHHIPNAAAALASCVNLLKPGAPFLVYLYYRFDNRPKWFASLWRASDLVRRVISKMPPRAKNLTTNVLAAIVYWPLARIAWICDRLGINSRNLPLFEYRNSSFYTMRTDSRDRFGTPLEQRFTRQEVELMMLRSGLEDIIFSENEPYWCAVGIKKH